MAKYGTEKFYGAGWPYGPDPQFLLEAGNIPGAEAFGMAAVLPGPVIISGVWTIPTVEAFGVPWIFRIPQKLAATPQIRRLKVSPHG